MSKSLIRENLSWYHCRNITNELDTDVFNKITFKEPSHFEWGAQQICLQY
jgi:hypothetical protein